MEIIQNAVIKINDIKDSAVFCEFMEENGGFLTDEIDDDIADDIADTLNIEIEDAFETFDALVEILKQIVEKFPQITLDVKGEEETTYDGIKYEITYKDRMMTIITSERFYKRYPEDYEEFVDFCEEFNIDAVIEEEQWASMDEEADDGWYFIDGVGARTIIELSEKKIIHI